MQKHLPQHPKRIETVHVETLDGELCIYDWQRMEVHNLNPTAATVWQLCDGQTTPQQMAQHLKGDLTPVQAEELVWLTLKRLEQAHLLDERNKVVRPAGPQREVYTRREMLVRLGVAAALLPVVSTIVAPEPVEAQSPQPPQPPPTGSQTFNFTGGQQQFTVPAGVTSVTVQAFGAQGALGINGFGDPDGAGGLGGSVTATITVTPGETLFVYVGGAGVTGGAGGFNGGGAGAAGIAPRVSGGGGGASDVRQGGNALTDRVVVAGGGGGSGASESSDAGAGGAGGGTTGAAGNDSAGGGASGGGGGTQVAGGVGGTGNPGADGANGGLGTGGDGGSGGDMPGGGGGGGYYGGGGGEGFIPPPPGGCGGGGGGSSFTTPGATGVTHQQGVRSGNGQVVISW